MTEAEFKTLEVGTVCEVIRGKDAHLKCVVLHKEQSEFEGYRGIRSMVVLAKPLSPNRKFESSTVAYRYFKLIDHTNLKILY